MNVKVAQALFAVAIFAILMNVPLPSAVDITQGTRVDLSGSGQAALAVLAMVVILWITEAIPFPVTGLLAIVLLTVTRAGSFPELVREGFGHEIVMFIIGVSIISAALNQSGLLKRVITVMLSYLGHNPKTIILTFLIVGALASMWITNLAVAAIFLPIGTSILKLCGAEKGKSNFGKALMISSAWGPVIGGITTPVGCGPNPITIGYLKDLAGIDLSFFQWMILGVPAALLMIPFAWFTLLKMFPIEDIDLAAAERGANRELAELGSFSFREIYTLIVMSIAIFLWVGKPFIVRLSGGSLDYLSISFVAIACSCLFFLPGLSVLTWKSVQEETDWGGIILIMTGLSLGSAIYHNGAAKWLATLAFAKIGAVHPIGQVFLVVFSVSLMKVVFSSNTVTGVIVVPLMIALANQLGINSAILAVPAGITASLAFILVTSSPTNIIPYSSGYFSISDMAKAGIVMTVMSSICVTVSMAITSHLVGIQLF
ncbi:SLC13 family permease [Candidatus Latescibacterota bacterium]